MVEYYTSPRDREGYVRRHADASYAIYEDGRKSQTGIFVTLGISEGKSLAQARVDCVRISVVFSRTPMQVYGEICKRITKRVR